MAVDAYKLSGALTPYQPLPPLPCGASPQDIELMHHFTTSTYAGLVDSKEVEYMWQTEAPKIAMRFPFLMKGILAVSAMHLAYLQPQKKKQWTMKALQYETSGLPSVRASMEQLGEDNCHALFAFSGLLVAYTQALNILESSAYWELDAICKWFELVRGAHNVLFASLHWLQNGPFAPMLRSPAFPVDYTLNPDDPILTNLYPLLMPHEAASNEEKENLRVTRAALDQLRRVSALPYQTVSPTGFKATIYQWPGSVSHEYVMLVEKRTPEALIVLAFYSLIIKRAGKSWIMYDSGASHLLRSIEACLTEEWHSWLDYPKRQVYQGEMAWAASQVEEPRG